MDFWSALAVLGRRWRILVAGVLVTAAGLYGVYVGVAKTYVVEGEVILLLPAQPGADATDLGLQNPYLGFGGSLNVMSFVIARTAGGPQAAASIADDGGTADFVVDVVPGDAPMLSIVAESDDGAEAMETYRAVSDFVYSELERRQAGAGAPEGLRIVASPVRTPVEPEPQYGSLVRAAAAVLILGGALTLCSAFFAESLAARRRGRRPTRTSASVEGLGIDEAVDVNPVRLREVPDGGDRPRERGREHAGAPGAGVAH